jgi:hypothetical protein
MPLSNYTVRRQLALWLLFYPLLVLQNDLVFNNVNRYLVLNNVPVKQKENLYNNNVPVRMLK